MKLLKLNTLRDTTGEMHVSNKFKRVVICSGFVPKQSIETVLLL